MIHVKPSATVTNACTACGGSPTGFVRYPTDHRHATYCPYISEVNADRWARWQSREWQQTPQAAYLRNWRT